MNLLEELTSLGNGCNFFIRLNFSLLHLINFLFCKDCWSQSYLHLSWTIWIITCFVHFNLLGIPFVSVLKFIIYEFAYPFPENI